MNKKYKIELDFGPGRENSTGDFILKNYKYNRSENKTDVLIFTDSRGSDIKETENSWTLRIFNFLKKIDQSVLVVVRPRNCTVFLTLLNFLNLNNLRFNYLIAQVGFVDFTPKKLELIKDIIGQKSSFFDKTRFETEKLNEYILSNRKKENLYYINFNKKSFKEEIVKHIEKYFKSAIFIETLEVDPEIKLKRERPVEFYNKLKETNKFLSDLHMMSKNIYYVQPSKESFYKAKFFTYDGVHYTRGTHKFIYELVKNNFKNIKGIE